MMSNLQALSVHNSHVLAQIFVRFSIFFIGGGGGGGGGGGVCGAQWLSLQSV